MSTKAHGHPAVGSRVELTRNVDRYPHFIAPVGARGIVVYVGDPRVYAVRLDEPLAGAEEWSNEVHWVDCEEDQPQHDLRVIAEPEGLHVVGPGQNGYAVRDVAGTYVADGLSRERAVELAAQGARIEESEIRIVRDAETGETVGEFVLADEEAVIYKRPDGSRGMASQDVVDVVRQEPASASAASRVERRSEPANRQHDAGGSPAVTRAPAQRVTLELELRDAAAIAEALKTFAELDQGDNTDYDELLRLSGLISKHVVSPVELVLAALPDPFPTALNYIEAADRALQAGMVGYRGFGEQGRRFLADLLAECGPNPTDRRELAVWLVDQLTAE